MDNSCKQTQKMKRSRKRTHQIQAAKITTNRRRTSSPLHSPAYIHSYGRIQHNYVHLEQHLRPRRHMSYSPPIIRLYTLDDVLVILHRMTKIPRIILTDTRKIRSKGGDTNAKHVACGSVLYRIRKSLTKKSSVSLTHCSSVSIMSPHCQYYGVTVTSSLPAVHSRIRNRESFCRCHGPGPPLIFT